MHHKARDYLDNPDNAQCPLYYAVTPNYQNSELIPRTVSIDMESCDQSLSEHITVFNDLWKYGGFGGKSFAVLFGALGALLMTPLILSIYIIIYQCVNAIV